MGNILGLVIVVIYIWGMVTIIMQEWVFGLIAGLFFPPFAVIYQIGVWAGGWG